MTKTLDEFDITISSVPKATFDYLASLPRASWIYFENSLSELAARGFAAVERSV